MIDVASSCATLLGQRRASRVGEWLDERDERAGPPGCQFNNMKPDHIPGLLGVALLVAGCNASRTVDLAAPPANNPTPADTQPPMSHQIVKADAEWKKELTPEQYAVLRQKATERPFTGAYWNTKTPGVYRCAGCGAILFQSATKFDAGCGWPSFYTPDATNAIAEAADDSHSMQRTEVLCAKCGGHLGHVFNDGPQPTGLRYCINSASLKFEASNGEKK